MGTGMTLFVTGILLVTMATKNKKEWRDKIEAYKLLLILGYSFIGGAIITGCIDIIFDKLEKLI